MCETNIDDCQTHSCDNNSTCIDGVGEYTCLCPEGFNGSLCEIKIGRFKNWLYHGLSACAGDNPRPIARELLNLVDYLQHRRTNHGITI